MIGIVCGGADLAEIELVSIDPDEMSNERDELVLMGERFADQLLVLFSSKSTLEMRLVYSNRRHQSESQNNRSQSHPPNSTSQWNQKNVAEELHNRECEN